MPSHTHTADESRCNVDIGVGCIGVHTSADLIADTLEQQMLCRGRIGQIEGRSWRVKLNGLGLDKTNPDLNV